MGGVLWPHATLHEHRSRPFGRTRAAESGAGTSETVQENRERLASLWRYSKSHGISWNELDEAYVAFARMGKRQYDDWARIPQDGKLPKAAQEKRHAKNIATERLKRCCAPTEDGRRDPQSEFPSRVKRLASRIYTQKKKQHLGPWRPGKLSMHLRELVAARV